jgi:hypothetical protein
MILTRANPPIQIDWLPFFHFQGFSTRTEEKSTWSFYPTAAELQAHGLRVEVMITGPVHHGEVRLVKGSPASPKHLRVIRLRYCNATQITRAVEQLRPDFQQKGW